MAEYAGPDLSGMTIQQLLQVLADMNETVRATLQTIAEHTPDAPDRGNGWKVDCFIAGGYAQDCGDTIAGLLRTLEPSRKGR